MGSPDRFSFIDKLCQIPASDEVLLRRARFACEPEQPNDDEDSVESTGIVMLSVPETPEKTVIEEASLPRDAEPDVCLVQRAASLVGHSRNRSSVAKEEGLLEKVADLGRDAHVGSYSVEKLAGGGVEPAPKEIRVSRVEDLGVPSNSEGMSRSPWKRLKISDAEVDLGVARDSLRGDTAAKSRKSVDDIDKFKYVGGKNGGGLEKRALPGWIRGRKDADDRKKVEGASGRGGGSSNSGIAKEEEAKEEITLLDVLKMIADAQGYDDAAGLEGLSVWEVAKRKGMTFP